MYDNMKKRNFVSLTKWVWNAGPKSTGICVFSRLWEIRRSKKNLCRTKVAGNPNFFPRWSPKPSGNCSCNCPQIYSWQFFILKVNIMEYCWAFAESSSKTDNHWRHLRADVNISSRYFFQKPVPWWCAWQIFWDDHVVTLLSQYDFFVRHKP